ncbi:acyl carrier protein [Gordonia sp. L191]|uniref:acyl carrier protein n=1 Tax=Gordonia sp. L191 TaxID=2982699 RepID=UPI0024BF1895|nr:acyl carrier protein [Gordonia sp. L191]WHU49766.1 acyl carrier protein [Gordonia sp. L191]
MSIDEQHTSGPDRQVRRIVVAMAPNPPADAPAATDRLREDLGYESVRLIELTIALERAFGLSPLPPAELAGVRRVCDVVALIRRQIGDDHSLRVGADRSEKADDPVT